MKMRSDTSKIFTMLTEQEVKNLVAAHKEAPHLRQLQRKLAEEVTTMVHSKEELDKAVQASEILFGKATSENLRKLDEKTFLDIFDGVPQAEITQADLNEDLLEILSTKTSL